MLKVLSISTLLVLISTGLSQAGYIVGRDRIVAVEENMQAPSYKEEKVVVISKPRIEGAIKLISMEDFLALSDTKEKVVELKEQEEVKKELVKAEEAFVEEKVEVKPATKEENIAKTVMPSEVYISYETNKTTLLNEDAKKSLSEVAREAGDKTIKIVTYASGNSAMSRRVSLLRASIIKNNLKSLGLKDSNLEVQSLGNEINIDQAKVFIKE
jgi:outer membrane protein OmpA-like peptidoglycan-associated protein